MNLTKQLKEFHETFEQPTDMSIEGMFMKDFRDLMNFRIGLVKEELDETMKGLNRLDKAAEEGMQEIEASIKNGEDCAATDPQTGLPEYLRFYDQEKITAGKIELLDGIADTIYVLAGLADVLGMDISGALDEVHKSNMTKLDDEGNPVISDGNYGHPKGKVMKTDNFVPPKLEDFI